MLDSHTRSLIRSLTGSLYGNRWNSAASMLDGKATGMAWDFKNDIYAIKENGSVHTQGAISVDMAGQLPNGVSRNDNGFYLDGTTRFTTWDWRAVTGFDPTEFMIYAHIYNSNNTTGTRRKAYTFGLDNGSRLHHYAFVQNGQTRSWQASGGPTNKYNLYIPTTIVGLTETKRGLSFKTNDVTIHTDGQVSALHHHTPADNFLVEALLIGAYDDAGAGPLLATFSSLVIFNGNDTDAEVAARTTL